MIYVGSPNSSGTVGFGFEYVSWVIMSFWDANLWVCWFLGCPFLCSCEVVIWWLLWCMARRMNWCDGVNGGIGGRNPWLLWWQEWWFGKGRSPSQSFMLYKAQEKNDSQSMRYNPGGVSYGRSPILGCLTLVCRSRCWGTVHFVGWPDDEIVRIAMSLECMRWGVKRGMWGDVWGTEAWALRW